MKPGQEGMEKMGGGGEGEDALGSFHAPLFNRHVRASPAPSTVLGTPGRTMGEAEWGRERPRSGLGCPGSEAMEAAERCVLVFRGWSWNRCTRLGDSRALHLEMEALSWR